MARPRIPLDLDEIERLASCGLTDAQSCAALSIHPDTLRRRKRESDDFHAALLRGRARGHAAVASALYDKAVGGDFKSQVFYLKARAGWSEPERRMNHVSPYREEDTLGEAQMKAFNTQVSRYLRNRGNFP